MTRLIQKLVGSELRHTLNQGLVISFFVSLAFILVSLTPVGESINDVSRTLEFSIRSGTEQRPKIHESLKVLSLDDTTVAKLGYHDLSLAEWNYVIRGIAKQKPAAVYIFKVFDYYLGDSYAKKFVERMSKFDFPIYIAGAVSDAPLSERSHPSTKHLVNLKTHLPNPSRIRWISGQDRSWI